MVDKDTVVKVTEYRCHHGVDHVLVVWGDGTSSWERLASVNCKAQMLDFVNAGIAYLRRREEEEISAARKRKEAEMLRRLLAQNKMVPAKEQEEHSSGIKTPLRSENLIGVAPVRKFPCSNFRRGIKAIPAMGPVMAPVLCTPIPSVKPAVPIHNDASRSITNPNILTIYDFSLKLCEIMFYYKKGEAAISTNVGQMFFVPVRMVAARINSLYRKADGAFGVYCAELRCERECHKFAAFRSAVSRNELIAVHVSGKECWMLDFSLGLACMLDLVPRGDLLVLRAENDAHLLGLASFRRTLQRNVLWTDNKYSTPAQELANFLFSGQKLSGGLPALFIGNSKTAVGRHIISLIRGGPGLASAASDSCAVVIQEDYLDYVHQMRDFDTLITKNTKFYAVQNFSVFEILKSNGLFTMSERFLDYCDIRHVSSFLSELADIAGWGICVPSAVYNCFKLKAASAHIKHGDIAVFKRAYNLLKANCVEAQQFDYLSQLRRMFWRDYRHFYLIDNESACGQSISLLQAEKIIGL